jgi:pimeloyl-ACP methyl ester carboxylesterase
MPKKVVISVHGIRTRGVWQKELVPILARADFVPYVLDYGYFTVLSLLRRSRRERKIDWLLQEYNRIVQESGDQRPSIIAHSFGTFQVAELIERYPDVKFDNVIFAASIVRSDFDWARVLDGGQVNFVENDFGRRDFWPRLAAKVVRGAGDSGAAGFKCRNDWLNQRCFPHYKHSNYFHYIHFKQNWIPTLLLNMRQIIEILKGAIQTVATALSLSSGQVRAHLSMPDRSSNNRLLIVPGLHVNMHNESELKIPQPTNVAAMTMSSAATAFVTRRVATSKHNPHVKASGVLLPHPDLQWIISIPIVENDNPVLGVLEIDGLVPMDLDKLKPVADGLVPFAQVLIPSLTDMHKVG